MIVCICNNINDRTIIKDFESGLDPDQIIHKHDCHVCKTCNLYIHELYEEHTTNVLHCIAGVA